jgi:hypothetical protein
MSQDINYKNLDRAGRLIFFACKAMQSWLNSSFWSHEILFGLHYSAYMKF